ncbi:MAG: CBS domain-containing protein [Candidatus Dormibacteraeota bacterium]|nr:CBS domain-containing protein [Candidatus Dormibacteraeota bacterium]
MIPVKEIMSRKVITIDQDLGVGEVADLLTRSHITGAPVVDREGHVVGIVSEIDVLSKPGQKVSDIMSRHVISIGEDSSVEQAARLLADQRIRRLPVMAQGRMVGLLSRSDILEFFAHSHWTCGSCAQTYRGLEAPAECGFCQGRDFQLERESAPGT